MNWKKAKIYCSPQSIELLSAVLMNNGINGFIINDPNTVKEIFNDERNRWAYIEDDLQDYIDFDCNIEVYFPEDAQGRESLINVRSAVTALKQQSFDFDLGSLKFEYGEADDELWLNNWKNSFKPIKIGDTFYIKPSWETISEEHNRHVIEMDPANSFGSGTHATTQLCLTAFEKIYDKSLHNKVLDIGCGSGILGIGAYLSGVEKISFVDIDLHCTATSKENAAYNKLNSDNLDFCCGNILTDKDLTRKLHATKYHIVFANIMAEILIEMSPILKSFVEKNGYIILSGIIAQRLAAVKEAFIKNGYSIFSTDIKDEWCAVVVQIT